VSQRFHPHPGPRGHTARPASTLSRRSLLFGGVSAAALAALSACGSDSGSPSDPGGDAGGPWEFTDDRGQKAARQTRPTRIVAQAGSAGALWDLGIKPVGVFGEQNGSEILLGNVDTSAVTWVGNTWGDFNVEKFASLTPDLLVTPVQSGDSLWYVPDAVVDKISAISAVVGIRYVETPVDKVIDRYADLAASLGADLQAESVVTAKTAFTAAGNALREAATANAGLRVMVVSAAKENLYVANPTMFSDLYHLKNLGVPFVTPVPPADEPHWEVLSWEQADKHAADVILYDARNASFFTTDLASYPTFARLPAVRAGQLYPWNLETPTSWAAFAPALTELADKLAAAKAVTG